MFEINPVQHTSQQQSPQGKHPVASDHDDGQPATQGTKPSISPVRGGDSMTRKLCLAARRHLVREMGDIAVLVGVIGTIGALWFDVARVLWF